jgi:hypothetical protein
MSDILTDMHETLCNAFKRCGFDPLQSAATTTLGLGSELMVLDGSRGRFLAVFHSIS